MKRPMNKVTNQDETHFSLGFFLSYQFLPYVICIYWVYESIFNDGKMGVITPSLGIVSTLTVGCTIANM